MADAILLRLKSVFWYEIKPTPFYKLKYVVASTHLQLKLLLAPCYCDFCEWLSLFLTTCICYCWVCYCYNSAPWICSLSHVIQCFDSHGLTKQNGKVESKLTKVKNKIKSMQTKGIIIEGDLDLLVKIIGRWSVITRQRNYLHLCDVRNQNS